MIYKDEDIIHRISPDFEKAIHLEGQGIGISAPGKEYDCVSRFFDPKLKVDEDPVTGFIHCMIAPYWAKQFKKNTLCAYQASLRGGKLLCQVQKTGYHCRKGGFVCDKRIENRRKINENIDCVFFGRRKYKKSGLESGVYAEG